MTSISRRLGLVAVGTVIAAVGSLAGPAGIAAAADPITTDPAPALTAPADNAATPLKDVVLSWTPVAHATGYQIQLSPNQDWTDNVVDLPGAGKTVNTTYEVPVSLPHDEYFWRVRGFDAGASGAWSVSRVFLHDWTSSELTQVKPPTSADPTITWTPVHEASLYRVRYSTDPTFPTDPKLTATCFTNQTSFTPYTLQSSGEGLSASCFKATDITDGVQLYYQVTAYDDSIAPLVAGDTAPDPKFDCASSQPECLADDIFGGTFTYSAPVAGSPVAGAVTGLAATLLPTAASCTAGVCAATPTFSWNPVAGANYYRVTIWRDPAKTNVYRVYDTQWPSLTPRDALLDAQAGSGYYWSVLAGTCTNSVTDLTCGSPVLSGASGGSGGGGSATPTITFVGGGSSTFAKRSGSVTLAAPANNARLSGGNLTFSWSDFQDSGGAGVYDARNYRVQVAKDASFDSIVLDNSGVDMTRWTNPASKLADGDYYWRVQPVDGSGNGLTWSGVRHFTLDGTAPVLTLTDANGVASNGKLHAVADEPLGSGVVSASTLHVVSVVGGAVNVAGSWAQTSPTAWTFTPSSPLVVGQTYGLSVVGTSLKDAAGNVAKAASRSVRVTRIADDKSTAWHYSTGWTRHSSTNAIGGTYVSAASGHSATLSVVGSSISVYGCKGPSLGKLAISVDGVSRTVSEKQSFTKCGVLLWSGPASTNKVHALKLTTSGTATFDEVKVA